VKTTVVGLFDDMFHAQSAAADLQTEGVPQANISVMANEEERTEPMPVISGEATEEAALAGAGTGAALGGAAGLAIGLASLAIPGVGPVLVAGPLLAALSGALLGAATGGIIGALVDIGVPETEAAYYAEGVRRGGVVLTAQVEPTLSARAREILSSNGAVDIHQRVTQWKEAGWTGYEQSLPGAESDARRAA
jgi:hypothetical protein